MRILHVITKLELGGAQQNTLHACERLAALGHDVTLASGPGGLLDARAAAGPYRHVVIPDLVRAISPVRDVRAALDLLRLVRALRPDVVHTHSSKAGALGRLAGKLGRARAVVHTVHGWSFSDRHPPLERRAFQAVEIALRPFTDHYISVSRRDVAQGLGAFLAPPGRVTVIRSGIDVAAFGRGEAGGLSVRRDWGVADAEVLVVNASCFKPQKAPLDYVSAASVAAREEPSLRFALVGDGELRAAVEARARESGLGDRFILPGWRHDMPEVLHAADVVALTSLWEGLPRTVVQARAASRPVVATRVNGTPEAIQDGVHGFLLEPGDTQGFARAFVRLARDADLRRRMGAAGPVGLEEFDEDLTVTQQVEVHRRLLG